MTHKEPKLSFEQYFDEVASVPCPFDAREDLGCYITAEGCSEVAALIAPICVTLRLLPLRIRTAEFAEERRIGFNLSQ